jgi:hypothetical protein
MGVSDVLPAFLLMRLLQLTIGGIMPKTARLDQLDLPIHRLAFALRAEREPINQAKNST